jgi:hypothetical protein
MKPIEFTLGFLDNLHYFFVITAIIATVVAVFLQIILLIEGGDLPANKRATLVQISHIALASCLILWFGFCIPTLKDIQVVREGLIKLSLMSPESIKDGTCEIDSVTGRIHCKGVSK